MESSSNIGFIRNLRGIVMRVFYLKMVRWSVGISRTASDSAWKRRPQSSYWKSWRNSRNTVKKGVAAKFGNAFLGRLLDYRTQDPSRSFNRIFFLILLKAALLARFLVMCNRDATPV